MEKYILFSLPCLYHYKTSCSAAFLYVSSVWISRIYIFSSTSTNGRALEKYILFSLSCLYHYKTPCSAAFLYVSSVWISHIYIFSSTSTNGREMEKYICDLSTRSSPPFPKRLPPLFSAYTLRISLIAPTNAALLASASSALVPTTDA